MTAIKIYGVPPSPFTRAVRLACREKGVDYELVPTRPGETAPLNPLGKIPMMKHGDFTLYESPAIVRYVDRTFEGPPLWPEDTKGSSLCDQWLSVVCDSMVQTALAGVIAPRFGIIPGTEEGIQAALKRSVKVVGIFDKHLADHRFLAGEQVSAADLFLVPIFFYFPEIPELKALLESSPNCGRWVREMGARPSVKATDPQFRGLNR
jgi:glutathione S-transferase